MIQKSQNQWPAASKPELIGITNYTIQLKRGAMTLPLAPDASAPLLQMIAWWDQNITPVKVIHGWNYRAVAGGATKELSNHASGTAIDINPDDHPLEAVDPVTKKGLGVSDTGKKAVGTIPSKLVPALLAKTKELGLRWGGSYRGRKDEMHFEYISPPPAPPSLAGYDFEPVVYRREPFTARANSWYVPPDEWYKHPLVWVGGGLIALMSVVIPVAIYAGRKSR